MAAFTRRSCHVALAPTTVDVDVIVHVDVDVSRLITSEILKNR
jgi:hypothetical protein